MEPAGRDQGGLAPRELASIGPYRPIELLGQGGMGRVFCAAHRDTGERVALKTVRAVDQTRLSSIRREIHALSLLRHPGVVRILAKGVSRGVPWYAMELLRGATLADVLEQRRAHGSDAPQPVSRTLTSTAPQPAAAIGAHERSRPGAAGPATWSGAAGPAIWSNEALLAIIRGLCPPLAYLHGHGIVHRDLKPDNIFLRDRGAPIITDLGIATRFGGTLGREELIADDKVLGTHLYMAPEQIRGEHVDARADLYALGCIFYECLTGRPPFTGAVSWVLAQHLEVEPEPPSRHIPSIAPDIAAELDALVLALLAKRPKHRLGYAEDVDAALDRLGVPSPYKPGERRARAYLYRPQLAGRDAPLTALQARLARAASAQRGGLVLVGGESGVGKTRLVMELARAAKRHDAVVVSGQCQTLSAAGATSAGDQRGQAAPLSPLRPLLLAVADRCRELGAPATRRMLGAHGRLLAAYEPGLAALPCEHDHPEPAVLPAEQARERLFHALRAVLFAFAADRPVLLVLDDLQWADELSLGFLRGLVHAGGASELAGHGVLVVGTYRMDQAGPELDAIAHAEGVGHIELGRLDEASVRAIIGDMLALDAPPEPFAEFLASTSSGNPFFIAEYMHLAMSEGLLHRDRSGTWRVRTTGGALEDALPLPRALAGLIERRVAGLSHACRALLQLAAVLGRAFDGELLIWGAELGDEAAMDGIETLRRRQIFEEGDAGRLRFVHDKLRELAYAGIDAGRRAVLHHRAALAIERFCGDDPAMAQSLAHHWAGAGVADQAALCFLRAGDHARASYANREAATMYGAAIEQIRAVLGAGADPGAEAGDSPGAWQERLARACQHLGDMRAACGQQAEARSAYSDALARVSPGDRVALARLYRKIGTSWQTHHRHDNALAAYGAAEAALAAPTGDSDPDWWQEWFLLQNDRIYVHYWLAQVDRMTALVDRVRPVIQEHGTPRQRAVFFDGVLHLWLRRQRYQLGDQALDAAHRALDAALASDDAACIANARFMLGLALLFAGELGELERAGSEMARAIDDAERIGDVTLLSRCLTYATIIARRRGRVDHTERLAERSLAAAHEARMLDYVGAGRANLAWVAWRRGNAALARAHGEAAIEPWDKLAQSYPYGMQWPGRLMLILLDARDERLTRAVDHARVLLDQAQVALPAALARGLGEAMAAWDAGDRERTRDGLARALRVAHEIGYL